MPRPRPGSPKRFLPLTSSIQPLLAATAAALAWLAPSVAVAQVSRDPEVERASPMVEPLHEAPIGSELERTSEAEARFMAAMLAHHKQGLEMIDLAMTRAVRSDLRLLVMRIRSNYEDESTMIRLWLRDRRKPHFTRVGSWNFVAAPADSAPDSAGLLTPQQMDLLKQAAGHEFDHRFLMNAILHHDHALGLIDTLMDSPDAARDEAVYRIVESIRGEQSAYIGHMQRMLREAGL